MKKIIVSALIMLLSFSVFSSEIVVYKNIRYRVETISSNDIESMITGASRVTGTNSRLKIVVISGDRVLTIRFISDVLNMNYNRATMLLRGRINSGKSSDFDTVDNVADAFKLVAGNIYRITYADDRSDYLAKRMGLNEMIVLYE